MSRGAHYNRNSRRSGGDRHQVIPVGGFRETPTLSIQCFEQRHRECDGKDSLFGGSVCECRCHTRSAGALHE